MHPTPDLEYTIFDTPVGRLSVAYHGPTACYSAFSFRSPRKVLKPSADAST